MAELIGENKVTLNTAAYFNPNVQSGQTRAGIEMPDYAAKYMDENDIIHPAVIYLTDEYGYDKDYYTDEDQPKAGTRSGGEYQFITGEELAQGTRFSGLRCTSSGSSLPTSSPISWPRSTDTPSPSWSVSSPLS